MQRVFRDPRFRPAWLALLLGLMVIICWLAFSNQPSEGTLPHADKLNHLAAFMALAVAARSSAAPGWRKTLWVVLALGAYGGLIELVQTQIPGRQGEWSDLLADMLGVGLGLLLTAALRGRAVASAGAGAGAGAGARQEQKKFD